MAQPRSDANSGEDRACGITPFTCAFSSCQWNCPVPTILPRPDHLPPISSRVILYSAIFGCAFVVLAALVALFILIAEGHPLHHYIAVGKVFAVPTGFLAILWGLVLLQRRSDQPTIHSHAQR